MNNKVSEYTDSVADCDFLSAVESKRLELIKEGKTPNEAMAESIEYAKELLTNEKEQELDDLANEADYVAKQELSMKHKQYLDAICNVVRGTTDLTHDEARLAAATIKHPIVDFDTWLRRTK